MIDFAQRLHSVQEYYFSKKLREVALLKASGKPIINLGIGSPDLQPPQKVLTGISKALSEINAAAAATAVAEWMSSSPASFMKGLTTTLSCLRGAWSGTSSLLLASPA